MICKQIEFPFDSLPMEVDSNQSIQMQLEETLNDLKRLYGDDPEFDHIPDKLYDGCMFLLEIAPKYDCAPNFQANGFRTFVKVTVKISKMLLISTESNELKRQQIRHLFFILQTGLDLCRKIHHKEEYYQKRINDNKDLLLVEGTDSLEDGNLFCGKLDIADLLLLLQTLKTPLSVLYAYYNLVWICPTIMQMLRFFTSFIAIYSSYWKSFHLNNWTNRYNRGVMITDMSHDIEIKCLQHIWNLTDYRVVKIFLSMNLWSGVYSKNVQVPRQTRWRIALFDGKIYDRQRPETADQEPKMFEFPPNRQPQVPCILIRSDRSAKSKSLFLHIHGGGFISQSADFHRVYLDDWAKKLQDITILSIDYSLSPQAPFPEALQEVLDCYLWLISDDPQVEATIGFRPQKIAVGGDSAGGNLAMALGLALLNIRKQMASDPNARTPSEQIKFPVGLFCFYTPFLLGTIISPSRLMTSIESLIPVSALLSCLAAYVPPHVLSNGCDANFVNPVYSAENQSSHAGSFLQKITNIFMKIFDVINIVSAPPAIPWYKKPETLKQSLNNLNKFVSNPLVSPLLAEDEALPHEIPLYLYPLTYDLFLDDSIEMAKRWKGKVFVEVIDDLPHGFLNFHKFSKKAKEASNKCIEHFSDVLG